MKLIVGLGNPGKKYKYTRHNVGFMFIDSYCGKVKFFKEFNSLVYETKVNKEKIIFAKPQTYMNLSGEAVKDIASYYKINSCDILVVRDDLDLDLGKIRLKFNSSSGGDNGIKSVIEKLGTKEFYQLKIGISKPSDSNIIDYVLTKFSRDELKIIEKAINNSQDIITKFINNEL